MSVARADHRVYMRALSCPVTAETYPEQQWRSKQATWICFFAIILPITVIAIGVFLYASMAMALISSSNADHGSTFNEVLQNLSTEGYEYQVIFSTHGRKLYETTDYDPHQVNTSISKYVTAQLVNFNRKVISVHNHPHEGSFSSQDLKNVSINPYMEKTVIVSQDCVRTLIPSHNTWPDSASVETFLQEYLNDILYAEAEGYIIIRKIVYIDGLPNYTYANTDALVQLFADTFGLIYTIEPLSDYTNS